MHDMGTSSSNPLSSAAMGNIDGPESTDTPCGICFDVPRIYGLMVNCSHVFCLECIRKWRKQGDRSHETTPQRMHKTCPVCRKHSDYVVPSDIFHVHDTPQKENKLRLFLARAAKTPCHYFTRSPSYARYCPHANQCRYAHRVNGLAYTFSHRELARMQEQREQLILQRNAEALFSELLAQEPAMAMEDGDFVWDIISGLMGHEERQEYETAPWDSPYSGNPWADQAWSEDDVYLEDEYLVDDEEEDDDFDDEDDFGDVPDLVSDDDMPDLVSDDSLPDLISDDEDVADLPPLVSDDDIPELLSDPEYPATLQTDDINRQLQDFLDGRPSSTRRNRGPSNPEAATPRHQQASLNSTSHPTPSPSTHPISQSQPSLPQSHSPPFSRRPLNPQRHTPPPSSRRPRPPRTRHQDIPRRRGPPHPIPPSNRDEISWTDDDNVTTETDGEISERERQHTQDREERGINARNWDSRANDLSFFLS